MARVNNVLMAGTQGAIGKQVVIRVRNGKTFASKYPDMSNVKPSPAQLKEKSRFAKAVRFAQTIIHNPAKKAAFKVKKGKSVYHAAIQEYLRTH
jgi:hypothetical protein